MTDSQLDLADPRWNADQAAIQDYVRSAGESRETGQPIKESDGDVPPAETAPSRNNSGDN